MSKQSQLEALRQLAERPGTPEEGTLALEILQRLEAKYRCAVEQEDDGDEDTFEILRAATAKDSKVLAL
jgi:hypothetical protein